MGTGNEFQSVYVAEIVGNLGPEDPTCTTGVDGPVLDVLRVGPHQVAERTLVGDLDLTVDGADLVDGLDLGAESSMNAEDFAWIDEILPSMTAPMGR